MVDDILTLFSLFARAKGCAADLARPCGRRARGPDRGDTMAGPTDPRWAPPSPVTHGTSAIDFTGAFVEQSGFVHFLFGT